jgi:pimeloyl-ACP methyl ester carboxylesterase
MELFTLTLANGATLSGWTNLPAVTPTTPRYRPLMVGLHGGTYSSDYFNVDEKHTAALASNGLGIPWVAIDHPGVKNSTSFHPIREGSSDHETYGEWLHKFILPAVWERFGAPQGCNSMVLLAHSLGVSGAVIAAAQHAKEASAVKDERGHYPLAGIIISGLGIHPVGEKPADRPANEIPEFIRFPDDVKDDMFLPKGTCDPAVYQHTNRLNLPVPFGEVQDAWDVWLPRVQTEWAPRVRVPVMIGMAERCIYWKGTEEHVREFAAAFSGSPRVDGSVIRGAPHNMEMSYWSQGWYARCFGFGMECAVSFSLA